MNRRIIGSLIFIAALSLGIFGVTRTLFNDTETSTGNKFVAGKFNLKIDNTCEYNGKVCRDGIWEGTQEACSCTWSQKDLTNELFFNFSDVKPGDYGEDTVSLHVDNNDSWLCAEVANVVNDDNGCDSPENKLDTTCGAGQGELGSNLLYTVWKDTDCDNQLDTLPGHCEGSTPAWDTDCHTITNEAVCKTASPPGEPTNLLCKWVEGQPTEQVLVSDAKVVSNYWPIADSTTGTGALTGGQDYCLGVSWKLPLETTNIVQSDSVTGDVKFTAVQSRHMENFTCASLYKEVCGDGIDNDYDGQIDEGCVVCGDGKVEGTEACDDNNTQTGDGCSASCTVEPGYQCTGQPSVCSLIAETCDGLDNNGNGQVDEGDPGGGGACTTKLLGVCAAGTMHCQNGSLQCVQNIQASAEACNGLDDDCDGAVDENNPGGGGACSTGLLGVCAAGTASCQNGSLKCTQNVQASAEACNGLDDDCDGVVDENNPSGGAACNTGLPGICTAGTTLCTGGAIACHQNQASQAEVCDGLDNNCDGVVDGALASAACPGYNHALGACIAGGCTLGSCLGGYGNCDNSPLNGCEAALNTDSNCGICGNFCGTGNHCLAGVCVPN